MFKITDLEDMEAYINEIDFENAFDSVEWEFLWKKNRKFSEYFTLTQSISQGCPILALLVLSRISCKQNY